MLAVCQYYDSVLQKKIVPFLRQCCMLENWRLLHANNPACCFWAKLQYELDIDAM
jgi:hypothetical protein